MLGNKLAQLLTYHVLFVKANDLMTTVILTIDNLFILIHHIWSVLSLKKYEMHVLPIKVMNDSIHFSYHIK